MIIKSKTFAVNFGQCMKNSDGHYSKESILNAIMLQAPKLVKHLPNNIALWLDKTSIQVLVDSQDLANESTERQRASLIKKAVRAESSRVYAAFDYFFNDYIDLGYHESKPLFKEVEFNDVIEMLKARGVGFDTNIDQKNTAHFAIYQLSLKKHQNQNHKLIIANELGMEQYK